MPAPALVASLELPLDPAAAFDTLVDELVGALSRHGLRFEPRPAGHITEGDVAVGRVLAWEPGVRLTLEWRAASWQPDAATQVELRVEPAGDGARVTLEHCGWGPLLGDGRDVAGWFASEVAAPLLAATAPAALGDWLTDRAARRPTGAPAREVYREPLYHYPGFLAILDELAPTPADRLLDVGCGGGAFLGRALASGCHAAGVDHSPDMVRLARAENTAAIVDGRLEVLKAPADRLPFGDASFTCATMHGVLGFLADPVAVLAEIRRVLVSGGRIVIAGSDPELRGTPAAPEPIASRLRFYDDDGLARLARGAGFGEVRVVRRDLEPYAREAGIPDEHVPLYALPSRFLLARTA